MLNIKCRKLRFAFELRPHYFLKTWRELKQQICLPINSYLLYSSRSSPSHVKHIYMQPELRQRSDSYIFVCIPDFLSKAKKQSANDCPLHFIAYQIAPNSRNRRPVGTTAQPASQPTHALVFRRPSSVPTLRSGGRSAPKNNSRVQ